MQINRIADWNILENPQISLVVLKQRTVKARLRGVILAACEASRCYAQFTTPSYGKPYRNFYYNAAYEAIALAARHLKAKRLAISIFRKVKTSTKALPFA